MAQPAAAVEKDEIVLLAEGRQQVPQRGGVSPAERLDVGTPENDVEVPGCLGDRGLDVRVPGEDRMDGRLRRVDLEEVIEIRHAQIDVDHDDRATGLGEASREVYRGRRFANPPFPARDRIDVPLGH